jgi:hypothetical protein
MNVTWELFQKKKRTSGRQQGNEAGNMNKVLIHIHKCPDKTYFKEQKKTNRVLFQTNLQDIVQPGAKRNF